MPFPSYKAFPSSKASQCQLKYSQADIVCSPCHWTKPNFLLLSYRLSIDEGRLEFVFAINEYSRTETLYNDFDDFEWHKIRIERKPTQFKLLVDGKIKANLPTDSTTLSSNLQLGGFPDSRSREQNSITDTEALMLYSIPLNWR